MHPRTLYFVVTRSTAGKLKTLIDEVQPLEDLASRVQGDDETARLAAAEELATAYRRWFSASLEALPNDLRDRFRSEHDGSTWNQHIKHFLQDPRMKNPIYRDNMNEATKLVWKPWQYPYKERFIGPLRQQQQYLEEALARYGASSTTTDALELLEQISRKLPVTFAILQSEYRGRPGLTVNDEYDVQHILHAISVLHFEEVEPEEPTPKMAGGSSRLDFLLKQERAAIETKMMMMMMRPGLSKKQLRDDLAVDIAYFRVHPDVDALFVLVYDPTRKITNAAGFERDLYSDSDDFSVRVVITT